MKHLILYSPRGTSHIVDVETGYITQYDYSGKAPQFSAGWKFLGLEHVKRNEFIPLREIVAHPEILSEISLTYKNGHPQYTVRVNDHGTTRVWGNTHLYGVSSIAVR